MLAFPKKTTDAFVVGGGPAGLAAAISLRDAGLSVVVADAAQPAIDKACGEGLMPDAVAALARLGIELPEERGSIFRGICFRTADSAATAYFPQGHGLGVRRTVLHDHMVRHALSRGVQMLWGTRVELLPDGRIAANGEEWRTRWIVGADGQRSRVRQIAGLDRAPSTERFGFRQHFRAKSWTDCVEVYWAAEGQAYVTPTAKNEICVALVVEEKADRMAKISQMFPALAVRLQGSEPASIERGSMTVCRRLPRVTRGSIALIGEAAGSVDAITGEGLALSFKQAFALREAVLRENLELYERQNREMRRMPFAMSRMMVFLGRHPQLQRRIVRASHVDTAFFSHLMAVHLGMRPPLNIAPARVASFGWNLVTA